MMIMGSTNFFLPYVFYQDSYQCPEGVTNCKEYVCSLPASERAQFVHDDLYSLATKFGDYRCDNNAELDLLQSFIYLGGVIGVIIGAFINEIITKRMLLIATVVANIVGLVMGLLGNTLLVSSIWIVYQLRGHWYSVLDNPMLHHRDSVLISARGTYDYEFHLLWTWGHTERIVLLLAQERNHVYHHSRSNSTSCPFGLSLLHRRNSL